MSHYRQVGNLQEQLFDELVTLTAKLCQVPIAFISLLEEETVWFKHTIGWAGAARLPLGLTLCSVVIRQQTSILFSDLQQAPCHYINSEKIDALGLRFYLGVPLRTAQGRLFGVLAILDEQARQPRPADQSLLAQFAALIGVLLDFYTATAQHTLPWLMGDNQLHEAVGQSMSWMHSLAERAETEIPAQGEVAFDYQGAISREAGRLTAFLHQYVDLATGRACLPSQFAPSPS